LEEIAALRMKLPGFVIGLPGFAQGCAEASALTSAEAEMLDRKTTTSYFFF
jgi:hypothetical protein